MTPVSRGHGRVCMPGPMSTADCTPEGQWPAGCCLSSLQTGSGMRFLPQLLTHLLSGLAIFVASILRKVIVANFKSKLLVPIFQQGHELKK